MVGVGLGGLTTFWGYGPGALGVASSFKRSVRGHSGKDDHWISLGMSPPILHLRSAMSLCPFLNPTHPFPLVFSAPGATDPHGNLTMGFPQRISAPNLGTCGHEISVAKLAFRPPRKSVTIGSVTRHGDPRKVGRDS